MEHQMTSVERSLIASLDQALAYTRRRIGDPELAADTLQDSLLKALRAADELREEDRVLPWFYRILNNSIKDIYRKTGRERARIEAFALESDDMPDEEDERIVCACLRELLPDLKDEYAEVLELVDLGEIDANTAAARLGITPGNLKVRRHRARQQLRARLEDVCRVCAEHGCLDCTCGHPRSSIIDHR